MYGKLFNGHQIFQPNVLTTLQCSIAYPLILQAELFQIFFFFFAVPCKWKPMPVAVEAQSLNHWTGKEVSFCDYFLVN